MEEANNINNKDYIKSLQVAKKLNIKVVQKSYIKPNIKRLKNNVNEEPLKVTGEWRKGNIIIINPKIATSYTILHEIGHALNGYMCCREHCEYAAHGAAIALSKAFKIKLPKGYKNFIDIYAGRSSKKSCGAINNV